MSQREKDPRLQALYDQGINVYSYSKLNTIDGCLYEAWQNYVRHDRGTNSIYGVLGNCIHDVLEDIVNQKATETDLLPALRRDLEDTALLGLDFPHDYRGGNTIRCKWVADMTHFCTHYIAPKGNFKTEQLLILKLKNNRALIGYSDLIKFFADGSVQVLDYKTSSQFKAEDLIHHGRQLVAYSMALEQAGYTVRNPAWIMLKYLEVQYSGYARTGAKQPSAITKVCNRSLLYQTIAPAVEARLNALGVDEIETELLMNSLRKTNTLDAFPLNIQQDFSIRPYVRSYPLSPKLRQECLEYIHRVADLYESLPKTPDTPWPAREINRKNLFKCVNLCGQRSRCPQLKNYLARTAVKPPKQSDADLF